MESLTQSQNESYVSLAILLYQSDNKVSTEELDQFDTMCSELNWRGGLSLKSFQATALNEARKALDSQVEPYIEKHAKNLDSPVLISKLIELCGADGILCSAEHDIMKLIEKYK